jgi:predicted trehalose synthase
VELAQEKLARVTAAQQARIDEWQARNAASLAETGKPLRNPPRQPASEHCRVKEAAAQVGKALARQQAAEQRAAEKEKNRKGPGPVRNITGPDSRLMPVRGGGFIQGYNT